MFPRLKPKDFFVVTVTSLPKFRRCSPSDTPSECAAHLHPAIVHGTGTVHGHLSGAMCLPETESAPRRPHLCGEDSFIATAMTLAASELMTRAPQSRG